MIITEILCKQSGIAERVSDKTEEIIILEKFVDKIRFNYSNSFQKKKFVSKRKNLRFQKKTPHSFPKEKSSFPEKPPIRFLEKRLHEKRLICFLEVSRVCI